MNRDADKRVVPPVIYKPLLEGDQTFHQGRTPLMLTAHLERQCGFIKLFVDSGEQLARIVDIEQRLPCRLDIVS